MKETMNITNVCREINFYTKLPLASGTKRTKAYVCVVMSITAVMSIVNVVMSIITVAMSITAVRCP
jgi:hypothetical protein